MTRTNRSSFLALYRGRADERCRAGAGSADAGRGGAALAGGRGAAPILPPFMQTAPKPAIANAKPVRTCESLATVALPNTTIESAVVDPMNPGICRVTAITTHPPVARQDSHLGRYPNLELERTLCGNRWRRTRRREPCGREPTGGAGLCRRRNRRRARGRSGTFALDANGRLNWEGDPQLRARRHSRDDRDRQGAHAGDVRRGAAVFLFQRLLDRRTPGAHGGAAVSAGLQRHHVGGAGNQLEPVPSAASLGTGRDERGGQSCRRVQADGGDGRRDRRLRRHRRREGRRHRRSEALHVRPEAADRNVGGRVWLVHRGRRQRHPQAVGRTAPRRRELHVVRAGSWRRHERAVDQQGHASTSRAVRRWRWIGSDIS